MSRKITSSQKHALMTRLLGSAQGRQRIAANIQEPLRKLRDYQAVGRRAFFVDELPDGTLPIYDMDVTTPAYVVGEEADSVMTVVHAKRMLVPLFELASYPKVPFTQVKERRFDIIRRIKQKARDELFRAEDNLIFALFSKCAAANIVNVTVSISRSSFVIGKMADLFAVIETHGLRVDKIYLNALNFPVIRKAGRDFADFETQRELLRTGYLGNLWGASIYMSPQCQNNTIYFITEPEYLGVLPVRIDLTVVPADDPANRAFGWSIFENIGLGVHNSDNGLVALVLT